MWTFWISLKFYLAIHCPFTSKDEHYKWYLWTCTLSDVTSKSVTVWEPRVPGLELSVEWRWSSSSASAGERGGCEEASDSCRPSGHWRDGRRDSESEGLPTSDYTDAEHASYRTSAYTHRHKTLYRKWCLFSRLINRLFVKEINTKSTTEI